mmetsp:Transcript_11423/g.16827  ORF Transcript_11423/g.16827 Transcript_11423/m.16827 type:complete len:268 (+) Transcript_11423:42-845(+)
MKVSLKLTFLLLGACNVAATKRTLKGAKSAKGGKSTKSTSSAVRVNTMWWVLFNKPSACVEYSATSDGPHCSLRDVTGPDADTENNGAQISIVHASGDISDEDGNIRFVSSIYKSCNERLLDLTGENGVNAWGGPEFWVVPFGGSIGYCPADGEDTEIHIVLRDHGPPTEDLIQQLTTFTDPSCGQRGGPNLCVDNGVSAFAPIAMDGSVTQGVNIFPFFNPATCFDSNFVVCTQEQVDAQIESGTATLARTGDALQAIVTLVVPEL